MYEKRMSLAHKLMIFFSMVFVILICILSFSMCFLAEKHMISSERQKIYENTEILGSAITITQRGLEWYDTRYDAYLQSVLSVFSEQYDRAKEEGKLPNLTSVLEQSPTFVNGTVYLYLISSDGIIVNTTFAPEMSLDLKKYPDFYERLTEIRKGNSFQFDPCEASFVDPTIRVKYGYLPSSDHQYILETGLECDSIEKERTSLFSYEMLLNKEIETDPTIISLFLYDTLDNELNSATTLTDSSQDTFSTVERNALYQKVLNTKEDIIKDYPENIRVHAFYIPYTDSDVVSARYLDKICIIVYDTHILNEHRVILLIICLFITILAVLIAITVSFYISQRLILPIEKIIDDIELIAQGNYEHRIQDTTGRETQRLQRAINQMITVIQTNILDIRKQKNLLDSELKLHKQADNELIIANEKLHHLSNITRHDILNQLTALLGYIGLAREEKEIHQISGYLDATERIGINIQNLIEFTRNYQNVGIKEWIWQNPEALFREIIQKMDLDSVFVSADLGGYLIYVDPLFEKVLYNLIENSLRHGGSNMDTITFAYAHEDGTLLIIYKDNGSGVAEEEKDQIFERGYGKNSGLGLFMIREILSMTGITIIENGVYGEGVRFEIRVPKNAYKKKDPVTTTQ